MRLVPNLFRGAALILLTVGLIRWASADTWQCKVNRITARCPTQHQCNDLSACNEHEEQVEIPNWGTFTTCLCPDQQHDCILAARIVMNGQGQQVVQLACYNNQCPNPGPCGTPITQSVCPACP